MPGAGIKFAFLAALIASAAAVGGTGNAAWFSADPSPGAGQVDVRTAVGHHFWIRGLGFLEPCPALDYLTCGVAARPYYGATDSIGFTVLALFNGAGYYRKSIFAQVRVDDGKVGFILPGTWETEDERAAAKAKVAAFEQRLKADSEASFRELDEKLRKIRSEAAARDIARAALLKKPDARIGMTAEQVRRDTSWGNPDHINRTVTATAEREQWVYGGGNYLYFDHGILTTVQSTR